MTMATSRQNQFVAGFYTMLAGPDPLAVLHMLSERTQDESLHVAKHREW